MGVIKIHNYRVLKETEIGRYVLDENSLVRIELTKGFPLVNIFTCKHV